MLTCGEDILCDLCPGGVFIGYGTSRRAQGQALSGGFVRGRILMGLDGFVRCIFRFGGMLVGPLILLLCSTPSPFVLFWRRLTGSISLVRWRVFWDCSFIGSVGGSCVHRVGSIQTYGMACRLGSRRTAAVVVSVKLVNIWSDFEHRTEKQLLKRGIAFCYAHGGMDGWVTMGHGKIGKKGRSRSVQRYVGLVHRRRLFTYYADDEYWTDTTQISSTLSTEKHTFHCKGLRL